MKRLALAFALVAWPASAQLVTPLNPPSVDTSNLATKSDVQAAQSAAAAAQAAIPPVCTTMPAKDTYTGSAGTVSLACTPPIDNTRPTQVQSTQAVTASDGSFSGSFPTPFASTPAYAHAEIYSTATPYVCQINTVSATGYTGKCFQVISTTLPGTLLALGGLVVSPIASVAAGLTVKVIARQ